MRSFDCAVLKTRAFIVDAELVDVGISNGTLEDCCAFDATVMRVAGILSRRPGLRCGVGARMIAVGGVGDHYD
jgi:hypothetical protein